MARLLLADDDQELCELLAEYLGSEGFEVDRVHDGEQAVTAVLTDRYDLVILDIMMPKMNGFDALREVRRKNATPVLMLTARGDDVDRIVGLEMGADDYLPKPCNPRELVARIRAILRRIKPFQNEPDSQANTLVIDDVELQSSSRQVLCGGASVELTSTEFGVLAELMEHAGTVVSKKQLTETVLERKLTQYDRSMGMHVSHVRRKLGKTASGEERIKTVRNAGYLYVRPVATGANL
jgi:two-component system, OmpR family, response regulator CpxR